MRKPMKIAAIPGDGIGREVMPEGLRALQAADRRCGLGLEFVHFDWAHCDYYLQHGKMMPDDWKQQLLGCDAIRLGGQFELKYPKAASPELPLSACFCLPRCGSR